MRFKVELRDQVVRFLSRDCTDAERREFSAQLERVRDDPIEHSVAVPDPEMSRYMLRYFRFGTKVAVFRLDMFRDVVDVRKCRALDSG